jgi:putative NADH-flavin reductase
MVKVVVFGSTGKSGSLIVSELLNRGHHVTAIARDPSKVTVSSPNLQVIQGSVDGDLVSYITGADAVVNAYAPPFDNTGELVSFTKNLITAVKSANIGRLLMVGGAGGLTAGDAGLVINQPWFPKEWVPIAQSHIGTCNIIALFLVKSQFTCRCT